MHKRLTIILSICITTIFCKGQKVEANHPAIFVQYGQSLQTYFDTLVLPGDIKEPDSLNEDYDVIIYFIIDTNGNVINCRFEEDSLIPAKVKPIVRYLINRTNGKWLPEIKNGVAVPSDSIACLVGLRTKKLLPKDRAQKDETKEKKIWEEYKRTNDIGKLKSLMPVNKLSTFGLNKSDCFFTFYY
jgi:hypothetical protein